eukprot:1588518-Heterocapsa_arctica.AAC.1
MALRGENQHKGTHQVLRKGMTHQRLLKNLLRLTLTPTTDRAPPFLDRDAKYRKTNSNRNTAKNRNKDLCPGMGDDKAWPQEQQHRPLRTDKIRDFP